MIDEDKHDTENIQNIQNKENIQFILDIHDVYYSFGNYIYNELKPETRGNLDIFKYILGKYYIEAIFY